MNDSITVYESNRNPYPTWLKYADERNHLENWLRQNIKALCPKEDPAILDVGCGLGEATERISKILDEQHKEYTLTAFDPVPVQVAYCQNRFLKNSRIGIEQSTIEGYASDSFDLVTAIHPLYYVSDLRAAVAKICSMGTLCLIVHHGNHGINTIHQAFRHLVKKGPNIISTYRDVERVLDGIGRRYKTTCLETTVDIRTAHDPYNPEGNDLIRFFLEQPDLPQSTYRLVSGFLKGIGDYLSHDMGIIEVY